jgi:hypothetical protein
VPTYKQHQDNLLFYAGAENSGDPSTQVKAAINRYYFRVLQATNSDMQKRNDFTLVTRASASTYGLPLYVRGVMNIEDPENDRALTEITAGDYDRRYPDTAESGDPDLYYQMGDYGVQRQPAATGTITVVAAAAGDDGNRFVTVTGFDSSNDLFPPETLTLNGLTAVTSTNSYSRIQRLVKSANSGFSIDSNITVKDSSSNTMAVIPVWETSPTYKWVEFHFIPDGVITYNLRTVERKMPLVNDTDWPEIPEEYQDLLLYGPAGEILPKFGHVELGATYRDMYRERILEYTKETERRPNINAVFADISLEGGPSNRPLIRGVDIGLAT